MAPKASCRYHGSNPQSAANFPQEGFIRSSPWRAQGTRQRATRVRRLLHQGALIAVEYNYLSGA
jgi:ribulose bisphosphate carboxylase small subunit